MKHSDLVKEHFEMKYYDYDTLIRNLIPKYEEMHDLVVKSIDFPINSSMEILDLGIGHRNYEICLILHYLL